MILDDIVNFGNVGGLKRRTFRSVYISPTVKRAKKAVLGPLRSVNPFRQLRNAKQRVMRKVGYYSKPMKAFRYARKHGVGTAAKVFALRAAFGR